MGKDDKKGWKVAISKVEKQTVQSWQSTQQLPQLTELQQQTVAQWRKLINSLQHQQYQKHTLLCVVCDSPNKNQ